jgi:hypothetical protein
MSFGGLQNVAFPLKSRLHCWRIAADPQANRDISKRGQTGGHRFEIAIRTRKTACVAVSLLSAQIEM